jgi:hypothetical protein
MADREGTRAPRAAVGERFLRLPPLSDGWPRVLKRQMVVEGSRRASMDADHLFSQRNARDAAGCGSGAGTLIGPGAQVREAW